MINIRGTACCGMRELDGVSAYRSAPALLRDFGKQAYYIGVPNVSPIEARFRFVVFTQASAHNRGYGLKQTYGENLANFITKNNLGEVIKTEENTNPNTGNVLTAWIWSVNHARTTKWLTADLKRRQANRKKRS